jgi:hypothetical protein
LHVPWGASFVHLKHHFAVSIVFNFTWYHFVLNNIEGVMIPCLCALYFNSNKIFCVQTLGSFLILFRAQFWSYHNIFIQFILWIFWLLLSFVENLSIVLSYFVCNLWSSIEFGFLQIFAFVYVHVFSLISFGYAHRFGGTLTILVF